MNLQELEKLVEGCGVALYDTEVASENGRQIYRVYITKSGGVSLEDCEAVSKLLSPIYDVMPPVSGDWILEVSSPGLERKLTKPEHFIRSTGELVKIILSDKSEIIGTIKSTSGDEIVIDANGQSVNLNFNNIKKKFLTVTLADEKKTVLLLTMPNKALIDELISVQKSLTDAENLNGDALDEMYKVVAKLMSNNKAKKQITAKYLEDLFDFEDMVIFINEYTSFINDVVSQKN